VALLWRDSYVARGLAHHMKYHGNGCTPHFRLHSTAALPQLSRMQSGMPCSIRDSVGPMQPPKHSGRCSAMPSPVTHNYLRFTSHNSSTLKGDTANTTLQVFVRWQTGVRVALPGAGRLYYSKEREYAQRLETNNHLRALWVHTKQTKQAAFRRQTTCSQPLGATASAYRLPPHIHIAQGRRQHPLVKLQAFPGLPQTAQ
jgi:hypothetical protein